MSECKANDLICTNCYNHVFTASYVEKYGVPVDTNEANKELFEGIEKFLKDHTENSTEGYSDEYAEYVKGKQITVNTFCPVCGKLHESKLEYVVLGVDEYNKIVKDVALFDSFGLPNNAYFDTKNITKNIVIFKLASVNLLPEDKQPPKKYWFLGTGYSLINNSIMQLMQEENLEDPMILQTNPEYGDKINRMIWYVYDNYDSLIEDSLKKMEETQTSTATPVEV